MDKRKLNDFLIEIGVEKESLEFNKDKINKFVDEINTKININSFFIAKKLIEEKKAEEMFLKSSQKGYLGGTYNLGSLYEKQKKYKKAKKYFKMIIDLGNENDPITKEAQEVYRKLVQAGY